ncbi:uncharacterized protein LOC102804490 [Saccoglossus kowalevskii]|uniref:Uncharacterized protein LOC102804490 n=1 Tax=Saccoglossus kowalevskii TaxID=10224 RepID=A0ABM0MNV8_SACKO|nr:PREDICTED: uncharacterized protein LOC102804490 [Saccoglossus kowalevskii]
MNFSEPSENQRIDLIDQTQEYKVLRSAVSRNTSSIVKLRKRIFDLQKEEINLDTELINKKKKLEKMEMDKKDWLEISEFQFDLQDILQEFAGMEAHTKQADYKSSANIPAMMTDVTNTMTAVSNLRSINDDLQHWLDQH